MMEGATSDPFGGFRDAGSAGSREFPQVSNVISVCLKSYAHGSAATGLLTRTKRRAWLRRVLDTKHRPCGDDALRVGDDLDTDSEFSLLVAVG